jgi:DNA polymerase-3 subunit gamma/tau
MSYQALYRKFRPAEFEDVKGQDHIVETLKNQIMADRVGHAYLFCGTRGTGKTTVAKIFAKAVNCEHPVDGSPCGQCKSCKTIAAGASMNVIEIDAASNNGVDNIREIVDEVSYSPAEGKFKVYIIDEVHMLSIGAFNALLKTLEEPPEYVIFILATTEVHKIPITILSRCQRYDFKRIGIDTISGRLSELMDKENIQVEPKALRYIAKTADGSLRDALSLLDQCIAFHFGKELTYDMVLDVLGAVDNEVFSRLLRHMVNADVLSCISLLEEIVMQGRELTQFVSDYTWYLRNLLLVKNCDEVEDILDVSSDHLKLLKEEADMVDQNTIMRFIRIFSELSGQIRYASAKRVMIEMAIIKACRPAMEKDEESVLERIRVLENKIEKGLVVTQVNGMVAGTGSIEQNGQQSSMADKPQMPQAIPEEVEQIVKKWPVILNDCPNPMKAYLKTAKLSLGNDNHLQIYLVEGTYSDYFLKFSEHQEQLGYILSNAIGKEVVPDFKTYGSNENFEATNIDLSKMIMMDIEEEE